MKIPQIKSKIKALKLYIQHGVGTIEEIEDAQVQLDMYLEMLDDATRE